MLCFAVLAMIILPEGLSFSCAFVAIETTELQPCSWILLFSGSCYVFGCILAPWLLGGFFRERVVSVEGQFFMVL